MADSLMLNVGGKLVPTTSTALAGKNLPPASRPKKNSLLHRLSIRDASLADTSSGCFSVEMDPHLFEPLLAYLKGNGLPLAFGRHKERLLEAAVKLGLEKRVVEREFAAKARRAAEEVKETDGRALAVLAGPGKADHSNLKDVLSALGDLQNDRAKTLIPADHRGQGQTLTLKRELDPDARSPEARKRSAHCDCATISERREALKEMQRAQRIASLQSQLVQSEAANARLREEATRFQESQRRIQNCVDRKSQIFDTIHQQYKRACQEREDYLRKQMALLEQRCEKMAQLTNGPLMVDASTSPPLFLDPAKPHTARSFRRDRHVTDDIRRWNPVSSVLTAEDTKLNMPEIPGSANHSDGMAGSDRRIYGGIDGQKARMDIFRDMDISVETKTKTPEKELYIHSNKRPYSLMERTIEGCGFGVPSAKRLLRSRNRSTIHASSESENNLFRRQLENVPVVSLSALATFACLISPDVSEPVDRLPVSSAAKGNGPMHYRSLSHPSLNTYDLHLPNTLTYSRTPPTGAPITPCFDRYRLNSRS